MKRDFKKWHALKSQIDATDRDVLYREREIWWSALGANVGVETDGKNELFERPVLVLRKFNKDMFWGLPLTSRSKTGKPFYFSVSLHGAPQTVVFSQLRVLSSKRLIRRLGKLSDSQFNVLNKAFSDYIKRNGPLSGSSGA